jgi:hypothetical protein
MTGLSGFFTLIQSRDGPDRQGAESRLDTMPSRLILQEWWTSVGPLVTPATITHVNISDNLPNGLHLEVNEAIEWGASDTKVASGCADITLSAGESHFAHIDRQLGNLHADALCHRPNVAPSFRYRPTRLPPALPAGLGRVGPTISSLLHFAVCPR